MKDEKKAPKLRFKGFTDDWEQCKLGDVYGHLYSGNTPSRKKSANFGGDTPWIRTADLNNGLIKSATEFLTYEGIKQLKILPENTIVLAMYGGFNQIGRTGILGFPATINQALVALTPHKNINQFFAQSYLNRHIIDWRRVAASSRKDPNITKEDVEKSEFSFGSLEEQNRISKLISRLDHTITLHEEKKRQLERLKSALLQKMFADKSGYPAIRFEGFSDEWEQCKLGDVFVERNQKTVADKKYPLCSFIAHKGVVPKAKYDRSFLVKSDDKKYKRTELNDFIYSSNNLETGSIGLNKFGNATISPVYSVFMVKGNSEFIAGLATTHRFIYEMIRFRQGVVYGQWRIHESDFLKIKYYIPQVLEQEEIGNLLSELDRTITLHDQKLNLLKLVKQSLLQNMFI